MFTGREKRLIDDGYFNIIREEEKFIELISNNTKHQWIIFKNSVESDKHVALYHKHTANTKYYHKHWETWSVAKAVESIKSHDKFVIESVDNIETNG